MASTDGAELSKKISAQARLLLRPLDLKGLVKRGIIVKKGDWYRILKFKALPEHALAQVSVLTQDSCGTSVKFLRWLRGPQLSSRRLSALIQNRIHDLEKQGLLPKGKG